MLPVADFKTDVGTCSAVTKLFGEKVIFVFAPDAIFVITLIVATVPVPFFAFALGEITIAYDNLPFLLSIFLSRVIGLSKKVPGIISIAVICSGLYESSTCTAVALFSPVSMARIKLADGEAITNGLGLSCSVVWATGVGAGAVRGGAIVGVPFFCGANAKAKSTPAISKRTSINAIVFLDIFNHLPGEQRLPVTG